MNSFEIAEIESRASSSWCGWRFYRGFKTGYELDYGYDYNGRYLGELTVCPNCGKPLAQLVDWHETTEHQINSWLSSILTTQKVQRIRVHPIPESGRAKYRTYLPVGAHSCLTKKRGNTAV